MDETYLGLIILGSLLTSHFLVYSNYSPGTVNRWHWMAGVLALVPIDGIIAFSYGLLSENLVVSFLIGFLPSTLTILLAAKKHNLHHRISYYVFLGIAMGAMGVGGAQYVLSASLLLLIVAVIAWILILFLALRTGIR
ncbi:hypothetical protein MUP77_24725 [Candidatus Bathyarchaeota archaeon]|nr:hypothetical protein [Candidatus Bathyarchaeota archaeon]